jgi:formate hydrogenlyase subunit 4
MTPETIRIIVTIAAAVLGAPLLGALLMGVDRRLTARMQGRVGPPLLQPIYDVLKLLGKESLALNQFQIFYAYLHLGFMMLVVVLLALGQDMLMILFAHAFSTIALILGGMSVRSPYSRIGGARKILQLLAYEPILVLMVIGIYMFNASAGHRSFLVSEVAASGQPLLPALPLVFLTFAVAAAIKLEKSPFDVATSHHAHQEIVKGVTIEYAGPYLAMIEIAQMYEVALVFVMLAFFWATNLWIGAALAAVVFLGQIVLDNTFARLTPMWMVRFMWTVPMVLAVTNIVWLYFRL